MESAAALTQGDAGDKRPCTGITLGLYPRSWDLFISPVCGAWALHGIKPGKGFRALWLWGSQAFWGVFCW